MFNDNIISDHDIIKKRGLSAITIGLLFYGVLFLMALALQQYNIFKMLLAGVLIPLVIYRSIVNPGAVLFICLIAYFTPEAELYGNIILFLYGLTIVIYHLLVKRIHIKVDIILLLWLAIGINAFLTIGRWHHLSLAMRGLLHFAFLPIIVYISIVKNIIDYDGCQRFIKIYFPIVISYAVIQVILYYFSNVAISKINSMSLHSGYGLGWGVSNTLATIMVLFATVLYSNPGFTRANPIVRTWFYFLIASTVMIAVMIISRGALLSLTLAVSVFYIIRSILEKRFDLWHWLGKLTILSLFITGLFYRYIVTLIDRFANLKIDQSTFGRLYVAWDSFAAMKKNLLIGPGPNQYRYHEFYRYLEDPHNIFLRYGVDFGIISMGIISLILMYPLYKILKLYRQKPVSAVNIYTLLMLPYLIALCNSQIEAAITKFNYGLVFWVFYSLIIRFTNDADKLQGDKYAWMN